MAKSSKSKKKKQAESNPKLLIIAAAVLAAGLVFVVLAGVVSPKGLKALFGVLGAGGIITGVGLAVLTLPAGSWQEIVYKEETVQLRKGKRVLGEIPYLNIATVQQDWIDPSPFDRYGVSRLCLAITLFNAKDKKSNWPYTPRYFRPCELRNGECDFVIPDNVYNTLPSIERELEGRIEVARAKRTKGGPKGTLEG